MIHHSHGAHVRHRSRRHHKHGFTIIEVMIVVVILSILTAIVYPRFRADHSRAGRLAWVVVPSSVQHTRDSVPVAVRVEDGSGRPLPGAMITFETSSPSDRVMTQLATSDAGGLARTVWRFGVDTVLDTLTAALQGQANISNTIVVRVVDAARSADPAKTP